MKHVTQIMAGPLLSVASCVQNEVQIRIFTTFTLSALGVVPCMTLIKIPCRPRHRRPIHWPQPLLLEVGAAKEYVGVVKNYVARQHSCLYALIGKMRQSALASLR